MSEHVALVTGSVKLGNLLRKKTIVAKYINNKVNSYLKMRMIMKKLILLLTVFVLSIVSAQGEHPTGSKKAEHPTVSIKPQTVQGEKITLPNLALAIESFVEADINLRGAFLVIDPRTNKALKLTLEKYIRRDYPM